MKRTLFVAAVCCSSHLFAQQSSTDTASHQLDEVVVTANKFEKKQSRTGKVISVIDEKMLQELKGRTLGEILNLASGTVINGANNTLGTNQRISIRGASDGNVLLLMNGTPLNDVSLISNYFDLNFIDVAAIERIEILKGGQSTLYGSDAVAGVINIITKQPAENFQLNGSAGLGSYSTFNGHVQLSGKAKSLSYLVSGARLSSGGFSSAYDSTMRAAYDKDGFEQNVVNAEAGIQLSDHHHLRFFGNYSRYRADIDAAAFRDDKDFFTTNKNWQAGTGFTSTLPQGKLQFNYSLNAVDRFYLDDSVDKASFGYFSRSDYKGITHFAELYHNRKLSNWEILAGADLRHNHTVQNYFSVSMFGPYQQPELTANAWQTSAYASAIYSRQHFNAEIGARWNHHNVYGNNFTYTFNPSFLASTSVKLFANLSSAFKVPSLYQLYDGFAGNIYLQPESSQNAEAGIEKFANNWKLRLTAFARNTQDAIQYVTVNPVTYEGRYVNANVQKNAGVETEFKLRSNRWNLSSNYTFNKGKITSGYNAAGDKLLKDTTYNNLYRVPEHAFNFFATYAFSKKLSVSSNFKILSSRLEPVYASVPRKLNGYHTLDISGRWAIQQHLEIFADFKNITDQKYFDVWGYNSRRFNFMAGARFQL